MRIKRETLVMLISVCLIILVTVSLSGTYAFASTDKKDAISIIHESADIPFAIVFP